MGFKPIVLERGKRVRERTQDTWGLWRKGVLDPESNVQFGEGGAGIAPGSATAGKVSLDRISSLVGRGAAGGLAQPGIQLGPGDGSPAPFCRDALRSLGAPIHNHNLADTFVF